MLSRLVIVVALLSGSALALATFEKTKFLVAEGKKQKEMNVRLHFTDQGMVLIDRKTSKQAAEIGYQSIQRISYEMAKRHRVEEGAALLALSAGTGVVLMMTKTKSHWLAVQYRNGDADKLAVLRLHKAEYGEIIAAAESKTGKQVEVLAEGSGIINPAAGSQNMERVVDYTPERVIAALKPAMERYGCSVTEEKRERIECKRPWNKGGREIQGVGGETITVRIAPQGNRTAVKIETEKGFVGRVRKKNWSTPVFNAMLKNLEGDASATRARTP